MVTRPKETAPCQSGRAPVTALRPWWWEWDFFDERREGILPQGSPPGKPAPSVEVHARHSGRARSGIGGFPVPAAGKGDDGPRDASGVSCAPAFIPTQTPSSHV